MIGLSPPTIGPTPCLEKQAPHLPWLQYPGRPREGNSNQWEDQKRRGYREGAGPNQEATPTCLCPALLYGT